MTIQEQKVWLVTGVSSGFGKALMSAIAEKGDIAVGTVRKEAQLQTTEDIYPGKTFAYLMDVNRPQEVESVINTTAERFGRIDVVVNNAGYGLIGAVEESSDEETRQQFETNVFGALSVTQKALPIMRKQGSGHFFQISSVGGVVAFPGAGIYNASKFALEGFSEAIAKEAEHLGIKVTIVEPGPFRTEWAGNSMKHTQTRLTDYDTSAGHFRTWLEGENGNQVGDPYLAAKAMVTLAHAENPPLNFPLGEMAIEAIREKMKRLEQDIARWEELSLATKFETSNA